MTSKQEIPKELSACETFRVVQLFQNGSINNQQKNHSKVNENTKHCEVIKLAEESFSVAFFKTWAKAQLLSN
ncbi:MAG: hypothetical protein ACI9P5_000395 [Saprospiraceae bacterium]|jgi:hypothetical protein